MARPQTRSARRLTGRHCGRDRQQPRGLAAAEDHGRALVGQPKPGSWIALAARAGVFQRKHRGRLSREPGFVTQVGKLQSATPARYYNSFL